MPNRESVRIEEDMDDLPPGFRFYPTEEELVSFYLPNKLDGTREDMDRVIPVVDIYDYEPWDLPQISGELCRGDPEQWFFFTAIQEKEARGGRPNRTTQSGFWKATGSPGYVYSSDNRVIGVKKTMVFYEGKAPSGRKTKWKMNEYRAIQGEATTSSCSIPKLRREFSVCRVYVKSGCLRAFDRRPSGSITETAPPQAQENNVPMTFHENSTPIVEKTSSPDCSSSGDDGQPSQIGEAADWEMNDTLDLPWEWEQFNWKF